MDDSLAIPASISYRQLQALAQSAPSDSGSGREPAAIEAEQDGLEAALQAWQHSSQALLQRLQQADPGLARGRGPQQLMALGALQAHLAMGLQALARSRRSQG
ncbi:MAG: hypothetical protein ACKOXO_06425 [Cyanobium sp.]